MTRSTGAPGRVIRRPVRTWWRPAWAAALLAAALEANAPTARAVVRATADDELAQRSAAAVRGIVQSVVVRRDATVAAPYTHVTIAVTRAWGFSPPPRHVDLKLLGGTIDGETLLVGGQARFAVGEDVLALLDVRPRDQSLSVTGLALGKWTVRSAGGATATAVRGMPGPDLVPETGRSLVDLEALAALAGSLVRLPAGEAPGSRRMLDERPGPPSTNTPLPGRWHEADWGVPVAVDAQSGGHPLFPGGGLTSLARAIAAWSGRRALSLQPGVLRGPRCFANGEQPDARISITYGDPCDEIADTSPTVAIGGVYVSSVDIREVGGVSFGRVTKGMVVLDNALGKFAGFSTGCYEELLSHELGHAVGLGHSEDDGAIMSPWLSPGCVERLEGRALQPADITALGSLYPDATVQPGPPGPPAAPSALIDGSSVNLTWSPSRGPVATAYQLVIGSTPGGADLGGLTVGSAGFAASGVQRGIYYVRVHAVNEFGNSPPSPETVVTVGAGWPGAPTGLMASASSGGDVRLAWRAPRDGPVPTGYSLLVGTASGRPSMRIPTATPSLAARGVPQGSYYVRAVAENHAGRGPASPEILVVVP